MIDTIENSRMKFKIKLIDNLEEYVIRFLNSKDNGIIYLGVNHNSVVVGLNNNLDLLQRTIKGIFNRFQAVNTIFCTE